MKMESLRRLSRLARRLASSLLLGDSVAGSCMEVSLRQHSKVHRASDSALCSSVACRPSKRIVSCRLADGAFGNFFLANDIVSMQVTLMAGTPSRDASLFNAEIS